jgi:pimeloyl-ACP methyl ester carboxylesterase
MIKTVVILIGLLLNSIANAEIKLTFAHESLTDGRTLNLESYEYLPASWNGKVIVMSHGSTGGNDSSIKASLKFLNISKFATDNGYIFVTYMRKGRGKSEGDFTEEIGRCDYGNLTRETQEAEAHLEQVIDQVTQKYSVQKVILMGHSRGGFLSSTYAGKNSSRVMAVVNLAGGWSTSCEGKNGGFGRRALEASAKSFRPQYWAYFQNDSYFAAGKFNDGDYAWFAQIASENGVTFRVFSDGGRPDGHQAPIWVPKEWANEFFPLLNIIVK